MTLSKIKIPSQCKFTEIEKHQRGNEKDYSKMVKIWEDYDKQTMTGVMFQVALFVATFV